MEQPSMTEFQAVEIIRNKMEEIPVWKVYYTMKLMKLNPVTTTMAQRMRECVAIHLLGLPITTDLLGAVEGKQRKRQRYNLASRLHNLGDKHCLTLKRGITAKGLQWMVHPVFLRHYNGKAEK